MDGKMEVELPKRIKGQDVFTMQEYIDRVEGNPEKIEEMARIVKEEQRTGINWIQSGLLWLALIVMAILYISGEYIEKEVQIVEICQGVPTEGYEWMETLDLPEHKSSSSTEPSIKSGSG